MRRSPSVEFLLLYLRSSSWSTDCATVSRTMSLLSRRRRISHRSQASRPRRGV